MLAELRLGLAPWVGLLGQYRGPRLPLSTAIVLVLGLCVLVILLRLFFGRRRGIAGWLTSRAARGIILLTSVLVVAEMNLPVVVGVAVIIASQAALYWYALLLFHRKY